MNSEQQQLILDAKKIVVIQAENPDGDSLGSALALEEVLGDLGKEVVLYCPINIPKYIRYFAGWDRVVDEFDYSADLAIIVDTASEILLSKLLDNPPTKNFLYSKPVLVFDHHTDATPDLQFPHEMVLMQAVATCEQLYRVFTDAGWTVNAQAAEHLLAGTLSDSLGLTTPNVTATTYESAAGMVKLGASPSVIEEKRRALMKKSPRILEYKADLIKRVEYHLGGRLATVHVNWEEIQEYSDEYNPNVLILEELRMVAGVDIAVAIKTYPDGKLTGKVRTTLPVADKVAGFFGGGGHAYASGFRIYEDYDTTLQELITAASDILDSANETI